jgi:hypothetical protein
VGEVLYLPQCLFPLWFFSASGEASSYLHDLNPKKTRVVLVWCLPSQLGVCRLSGDLNMSAR